jgi:hypothetical protein
MKKFNLTLKRNETNPKHGSALKLSQVAKMHANNNLK